MGCAIAASGRGDRGKGKGPSIERILLGFSNRQSGGSLSQDGRPRGFPHSGAKFRGHSATSVRTTPPIAMGHQGAPPKAALKANGDRDMPEAPRYTGERRINFGSIISTYRCNAKC